MVANCCGTRVWETEALFFEGNGSLDSSVLGEWWAKWWKLFSVRAIAILDNTGRKRDHYALKKKAWQQSRRPEIRPNDYILSRHGLILTFASTCDESFLSCSRNP